MSVFFIESEWVIQAEGPLTVVQQLALLASLRAVTTGLYEEVSIALFTNDVTPNPSHVLADFTAPVWTAYGPIDVAFTVPGGEGTYGSTMITSDAPFLSGTDADETVYGALLRTQAGLLVFGRRFPEPYPVFGAQAFSVLASLNFRFAG